MECRILALEAQIDMLAGYIIGKIEGEPSRSESACDVAIRVLAKQARIISRLKNGCKHLAAELSFAREDKIMAELALEEAEESKAILLKQLTDATTWRTDEPPKDGTMIVAQFHEICWPVLAKWIGGDYNYWFTSYNKETTVEVIRWLPIPQLEE